jgi:hypothetical protein
MMNRAFALVLIAVAAAATSVTAAPPAAAAEYCVFTDPIDYDGHYIWHGSEYCVPAP